MSSRMTAARFASMSGTVALLLAATVVGCERRPQQEARQPGRCDLPAPGASSEDFARCMRDLQYGEVAGAADTSELNCHTCTPAERTVRMVVAARSGARDFNARDPNLAAGGGFVLARIQNADSVRFDDLRLDPGQSAYWWWGRQRDNGRRSMLYVVDERNALVDSLPLVVAHCRDGTAPSDQAEWNRQHAPEQCETLVSNNNWWIACLNGCCTGSVMAQ